MCQLKGILLGDINMATAWCEKEAEVFFFKFIYMCSLYLEYSSSRVGQICAI